MKRLYPFLLFAMAGVNFYFASDTPFLFWLGIVFAVFGVLIIISWMFNKKPKPSDKRIDLSASESSRKSGVYEELLNLEDLRKKGIVSDNEFAAQKQRILNR